MAEPTNDNMADEDRARTLDVLALVLSPGVGPVLCQRLIDVFGSARAAVRAPRASLQRVRGIGPTKARAIVQVRADGDRRARDELDRAASAGIAVLVRGGAGYPALLDEIPSAPAVLFVKGPVAALDRFAVAMVGSRRCSSYGMEQAERFAGVLAGAGLTVVSGGARGIDAAAHRGALRASGMTVAVLGCGLGTVYPPEHGPMFEAMVAQGRGALVSELPMETAPTAENFPARNRIISGLSLGVLVVEAGARSGALITAKQAVEDHGREVMALPGRVDMISCRGSLGLLKSGAAAMVTEPGDVIELLESPARHLHGGTHAARFAAGPAQDAIDRNGADELGTGEDGAREAGPADVEVEPSGLGLAGSGMGSGPAAGRAASVLACLDRPRTLDEVAVACGLDAAAVRMALTELEIQGRVRRAGSRIEARGRSGFERNR